jgi:ABC-2 type transport system ATP-binding protein
MLSIKNISKIYETKKKRVNAINNLSLDVSDGEIVCFLGPNGAGKTTSVEIIGNFITPTKGNIYLDGISINEKKKYLEKVGVLFEGNKGVVKFLTPYENMIYFCGLRGINKRAISEKALMYIKELELEKYNNTRVNYLSKGNQQKVAIGCMLSMPVKLILLDEPTLGLDLDISNKIMKLFKREAKAMNKIFIITTHDAEFVEDVADRIVVLKEGNSQFIGTPKEFIEKMGSKRLRDAYLKFFEVK